LQGNLIRINYNGIKIVNNPNITIFILLSTSYFGILYTCRIRTLSPFLLSRATNQPALSLKILNKDKSLYKPKLKRYASTKMIKMILSGL
jgi:hypothetical protein